MRWKKTFTYKDLLTYRLSNQSTIPDFLLKKLKFTDKKSLLSQVYIVNLTLLWHSQETAGDQNVALAKLTLGQRLLVWFLSGTFGQRKVKFDTQGCNEITTLTPLIQYIQQSPDNKPWPPSQYGKYSPAELLQVDILNRSMQVPDNNEKTNIVSKENKSTTLSFQQTIEIEAEQTQDIDQTQETTLNNTVEIDIVLDAVVEQDIMVDLSVNHSLDDVAYRFAKMNFDDTSYWCHTLKRELQLNAQNKYDNEVSISVSISDDAKKMLEQLGDYAKTHARFDLEQLPLGFFIKEEKITLQEKKLVALIIAYNLMSFTETNNMMILV